MLVMLSTASASKANCCVSQGGTVVNADRQFGADLLIEDGLIHAVGKDLEVPLCYKCLSAFGILSTRMLHVAD